MKKRRFLATLSIFTLIFSICFGAFSFPKEVEAAEAKVATVTVWACNLKTGSSAPNFTGHSWIEVKNTSKKEITVGRYKLKAGDSMTVGTWGNKSNGKGIYYNMEAYYHKTIAPYNPRYSYSKTITAKQVKTLSDKINLNNTWTYDRNCTSFSKQVWNSIASSKEKLTGSNYPSSVSIAITNIKGYKKNTSMTKKNKADVKYYDWKSNKLKQASKI